MLNQLTSFSANIFRAGETSFAGSLSDLILKFCIHNHMIFLIFFDFFLFEFACWNCAIEYIIKHRRFGILL